MIDKLQSLKGKTKLIFIKILVIIDEMGYRRSNTFQLEDLFSRNALGIVKLYPEVLLIMKFLQTK